MTRAEPSETGPHRPGRQLAFGFLAGLLLAAAAQAQTSITSTAPPPNFSTLNSTGGAPAAPSGSTSTRPDPTTVVPSPTTSTQPPPNTSGLTSTAPPVTQPATQTAPPPNPGRAGTTVTTPSGNATPNPGALAEDVLRAQVEQSLPPPLPVVRLDNPAFVFSGADPDVAAGVQAWLATLQGPHDKYGNYEGKGFVGSYRPDAVNGALVQFLAQYLAGKRLVAVNAAQAAGLLESQTANRSAQVDAIVKAKEQQQAAQGATPPGPGGASGPENVPNIANGGSVGQHTGTSGPSTGGPAAPGPTQTTSGPAQSGSTGFNPTQGLGSTPTTSGTGNHAAAPQTPASLEAKYPGTVFDDQPKAFTANELGFLDDVLGRLPTAFVDGTEFQRDAAISVNGQPDNTIFGLTTTSADRAKPLLQISDRPESTSAADRVDFPAPPYATDQSQRLEFEGTVAHELTHRFLRYNPGGNYFPDIAKNPLLQSWASKFGWSYDPTKQQWTIDPKWKAAGATLYAVSVNPNEDMAESVMIYVFDPQRLKLASQDKYNFIRDNFHIAEQPNGNPTYPPPKNDSRYQAMFAATGS